MNLRLIYVTTSNKEEARKIGRKLIEEKLAECINIIGNVESIYWWKEKIEEANEAVLLVKTKEELVSEATSKIKELHSYEYPCVLVIPTF